MIYITSLDYIYNKLDACYVRLHSKFNEIRVYSRNERNNDGH